MVYFISISSFRVSDEGRFNALSKAQLDAIKTFQESGFREISIQWPRKELDISRRLKTKCSLLILMIRIYFLSRRIKDDDYVIVQYPEYYRSDKYTFPILRRRTRHLIILLHDIDSLRQHGVCEEWEMSILNQAERIFAHNESMALQLAGKGIPADKISTMRLFDFYSKAPMHTPETLSDHRFEIAFAGNLGKSPFLGKLNCYDWDRIVFNLYGKGLELSDSKSVKYAGSFAPEETDRILSGWGLVWDGDSIETCSGMAGNYLRFNSPHKLSLYLACGIPVIVWKESSLADWIVSNKLGIAIESLLDIPETIKSIDDSEYLEMADNCHKVGLELRNGAFLKKAMEEAI